MNFIKKHEIFPQNSESLKRIIYKNLVDDKKSKNKPDHYNDQTQFLESYYKNSYIPRDLIKNMITESDNIQESFNNFSHKTKFLEMSQLYTNDNNKQMLFIYYYDMDYNNMNIIKFSIQENNSTSLEIEFIDFESFSLKFDSKIRNIVLPYELKLIERTRLFYIDLFSLYCNDFTFSKNRIDTKDFQKLKTFNSPNIYLSHSFLNHFFLISKNGTISLFDDNLKFNQIELKNDLFKKLQKGIYFNHTNLLILYNKDFFGLLDARNKNLIIEKQLISNNKLYIDEIKYLNTFNFIIYSTQTTYLYDIRNSSLPVSEMPLNINFKGIELKNFLKSGINLQENHLNFSSNDYIGIDKSRKDFSVIHFSQKEELESKHLFKNFMDITLINTDSEIHDSCAFSFKDNFYIFTVDEYGGLNYHIYEKNKSNKICQNNENIEMNTNIEEIRVLFEENNVKRLFNIKEDHSKKINVCYENKNLSDNDLDNSDLDLNIFYNEENGSEDEEIKLNFGNLKINGNDKKVYEIVNKRSILKKLINNNNSEIEMTNQSKIPNEKLKYLDENFKSIEFDKISQLNSLLNKYK